MTTKSNALYDKRSWFQKNKEKIIAAGLVLLVLTLYVGGLIAQITLASASFISGETHTLSFGLIDCICANFNYGPQGLLVLLIVYIFLAIYLYKRYKDKHQIETESDVRGFKRELSGVHGTAKLIEDEKEASTFCEVGPLEMTSGMILGRFIDDPEHPEQVDKIISVPPDGQQWQKTDSGKYIVKTNPETGKREYVRKKLPVQTNRHVMAIGTSGSGKSFCYVRPAILQSIRQKESYVVVDAKMELYNSTSEYAKANGYVVKILNLEHPINSDSWDALAELKGSPQLGIEAQMFCQIIIDNTSNPNSKGDEIYANGEQNLLTALVLYILTAESYVGEKTLGAVYDLLSQYDDDAINSMITATDSRNPARPPWQTYITASPALRGNLRLGLSTRLQVLQDDTIKSITGINDISLTLPGETPCAYYVVMPVMHSTFRFISSLFFTCLFNKLWEKANALPGQRLRIPVNVILDEFIAVGKLPDFERKLSTVRSAGINLSMIFQNLAQLQGNYQDWESLISNCYAFVCLSCNDEVTAKYFSTRSGTMTTAVENIKVDRPMVKAGHVPSSVSHTYSTQSRPVLYPDEVMTMSREGKILIAFTGSCLVVADKYPYTAMIDPDNPIPIVDATKHAPEWVMRRRYEPKQETEDDRASIGYTPKQKTNPATPDTSFAVAETREDFNETLPVSSGVYNEQAATPDSSMYYPQQSDDDFEEAPDAEPTPPSKKPKNKSSNFSHAENSESLTAF